MRILAWLAGRAGGHGRDVALAAPEGPSLRALKAVRDGWFSIAALVQSSIRMACGRWEADVSGDLHGVSRRSSRMYRGYHSHLGRLEDPRHGRSRPYGPGRFCAGWRLALSGPLAGCGWLADMFDRRRSRASWPAGARPGRRSVMCGKPGAVTSGRRRGRSRRGRSVPSRDTVRRLGVNRGLRMRRYPHSSLLPR